MRQQVTLQLSNGDVFRGGLIGAPMKASGELVFTTAMVAYSESLTDPSYFGQILVFTYPLIGNYGVPGMPNEFDVQSTVGFESNNVHASAVIVASDSAEAFHWTSRQSLHHWLLDQGVPGIVGIDTRHLVHLIRESKNLLAKVIPDNGGKERLLGNLDTYKEDGFFDPNDHEIIREVSIPERKIYGKGNCRIALIDCGVKWNILRQLIDLDCEVELLPYDTELQNVDCSAWLISNGPGNPLKTGGVVQEVKKIYEGERPILGICLGHQIMCLAAGFETERMAFGHRSHNQPVYLLGSKKAYITSQNHGYMVKNENQPDSWEVWFRNVNDDSIEGIRHKSKPFRSVQFHPESAGGPRDTAWVLHQFVAEVKRHAKRT